MGVFWPAFSIMFGSIINTFSLEDKDEMVDEATRLCVIMFILGVVGFVLSPIARAPFILVAENRNIYFRKRVLESLLQQEPGWYETQNANEIATATNLACTHIKAAISQKTPDLIATIATAIYGILGAFIMGWHLALVICIFMPLYSKATGNIMKKYGSIAAKTFKAYKESGGMAD
jgi:ATP-binding cassette subfamily B (MDR/TAP) protein 1